MLTSLTVIEPRWVLTLSVVRLVGIFLPGWTTAIVASIEPVDVSSRTFVVCSEYDEPNLVVVSSIRGIIDSGIDIAGSTTKVPLIDSCFFCTTDMKFHACWMDEVLASASYWGGSSASGCCSLVYYIAGKLIFYIIFAGPNEPDELVRSSCRVQQPCRWLGTTVRLYVCRSRLFYTDLTHVQLRRSRTNFSPSVV
jgi:hypothetical protein